MKKLIKSASIVAVIMLASTTAIGCKSEEIIEADVVQDVAYEESAE